MPVRERDIRKPEEMMPESASHNPGISAAAATAARLGEKPAGRRRYVIAVLLLLLITVAYVDRMILSMAGPVLAQACFRRFCGGMRRPCS
jgi:hypothetical protein